MLGKTLRETGDAVAHIERALQRVAAVIGVDRAGVVVLPNTVFVSAPRPGIGADLLAVISSTLNLGQTEAVFQVLAEAEAGRLQPQDGIRALRAARELPPAIQRGSVSPATPRSVPDLRRSCTGLGLISGSRLL